MNTYKDQFTPWKPGTVVTHVKFDSHKTQNNFMHGCQEVDLLIEYQRIHATVSKFLSDWATEKEK